MNNASLTLIQSLIVKIWMGTKCKEGRFTNAVQFLVFGTSMVADCAYPWLREQPQHRATYSIRNVMLLWIKASIL